MAQIIKTEGLVIKSVGNLNLVLHNDITYSCTVRGKFRIKGIKTTNPIAVGDIVDFQVDDQQREGVIINIHNRKNYIIRKSINLSRQAHIIAANIDQAFLLVTMVNPKTHSAFIDRYLVSAEAYRIPTIILFNKIDIYEQKHFEEMHELQKVYESIPYKCIDISVETGHNLHIINNLLKDKISVISGNSGVGKSSLINKIAPNLNLKTAKISDVHLQGKHTTTFTELFQLENGGKIIDSPGIKGFGMVEMEAWEISHYFPEMFRLLDKCRYHNCTHTHEPHCAVKQAVEEGTISASRYNNYLGLLKNDENKYREDIYG